MKNTELIYLDKNKQNFRLHFLAKINLPTQLLPFFLTLTNLKFIKRMNQLKEIYPTRKHEPIILNISLIDFNIVSRRNTVN